MSLQVPFSDLGAIARAVWPEVEDQLSRTILAGSYIGGQAVSDFENEWAQYCGSSYAVGVANGTDALLLILEALDIGGGDEVVLPANTFFATAEAVVRAGAVPVFADVSPDTLLLTPQALEAALTPRTRAVIVVHLFGQMPDMPALQQVADRAGIVLLEDAAQAHGAQWLGRPAGSYGVAASFSFYPGKNLGAFGDAGAVVTSDAELAERIRSLGNHGRVPGQPGQHGLLGTNSRLDAVQAVVLSAKLRHNERWTQVRMERAAEYAHYLDDSPVRLVPAVPFARHVYHLFVVRVPNRDYVRLALASEGVETGIHYPVPCHRLPPLQKYAKGDLPATEEAAEEILSLPMFPHMTSEQVARVCSVLLDVVTTRPPVHAASVDHRG
jgi:dTDP-4-amino-4,6-dideoxygalactose transaminase